MSCGGESREEREVEDGDWDFGSKEQWKLLVLVLLFEVVLEFE